MLNLLEIVVVIVYNMFNFSDELLFGLYLEVGFMFSCKNSVFSY